MEIKRPATADSIADGIFAQYVVDDAVEHLYNINIFGRTVVTTVTNQKKGIKDWIHTNQPPVENTQHIIGFETNMIGNVMKDAFATVQICTGVRCLIIQMKGMKSFPRNLKKFVSRPDLIFVGMNVEYTVERFLEEMRMADEPWPPMKGLGEAAAERYGDGEMQLWEVTDLFNCVMGKQIKRPSLTAESRWDTEGKLSDEQVYCACIDAFASFELGRFFSQGYPDENTVIHEKSR